MWVLPGGGKSLKQCQESGGRSMGSGCFPASRHLLVGHATIQLIFQSQDFNVSLEYIAAVHPCALEASIYLSGATINPPLGRVCTFYHRAGCIR